MIEFMFGIVCGIFIGMSDNEPVPYQTITYTDSGRVVKVYSTSAFQYRYMPDSYSGWNTNNYNYWDTRQPMPVYTKSVIIKSKSRKSGEYKGKKGGNKGKKK
tara:strand:- start:886 stop:1191 length:306 start_codon:yes stop_codon:yes gene_type:complete